MIVVYVEHRYTQEQLDETLRVLKRQNGDIKLLNPTSIGQGAEENGLYPVCLGTDVVKGELDLDPTDLADEFEQVGEEVRLTDEDLLEVFEEVPESSWFAYKAEVACRSTQTGERYTGHTVTLVRADTVLDMYYDDPVTDYMTDTAVFADYVKSMGARPLRSYETIETLTESL